MFCFTYGSSYLASPTGKDKLSQIDLVLTVEDPLLWHTENMQINPNHYARHLHYLGPAFIVNSLEKAAGIHYAPYVQHAEFVYKYGVISAKNLIEDLQHWKTFYLAGRLQKPVEVLIKHGEIQQLMRENLKMAVIVAGLMSSSLFTENELYEQIAKLSYYGDRRLEDPNKVSNIIRGNLEKFHQAYRPILAEIPELELESGMIQRKNEFFKLMKFLPDWIKCYSEFENLDYTDRKEALIKLFSDNNSHYSTQQIWHAIKCTSPGKIIKYSFAKLLKSLK